MGGRLLHLRHAGALAAVIGVLAPPLFLPGVADGFGGARDTGTATGASQLTSPASTPRSPLAALGREAALDFRAGVTDALGPCANVALRLGVVATGSVWLSADAAVPGGISAGGAVIGAGEVMTQDAAALCTQTLERLLDDYRIARASAGTRQAPLAPLAATASVRHAACEDLHGRVAAFCIRLSGRVDALAAAATRTAAVDDALRAAVDRAASAQRAGDTAALATRVAHAAALERQFTAALAAEAPIGLQIRALIPRGNLTLARATATIGYVEGWLARDGVTSGAIATIDPAVLTPAAEDPVSRLVNP